LTTEKAFGFARRGELFLAWFEGLTISPRGQIVPGREHLDSSMLFHQSSNILTLELLTEAETNSLGRALATLAEPGRVIGLIGGLGAGKTRMTRGFAEALGVDPAAIASPTYVLIHEYDGHLPIYHFDAYRLAGPDDFDTLGASEYFAAGGVCIVEWADLVLDRLPDDAWLVRLVPTGPTSRSVTIEAPATDIDRIAEALRAV
jgi:tRNA threonylcarbamoyladenosine biosynthesis protein TsaE